MTQDRGGTEPPFTGRLLHIQRDGVYHCTCGTPLSLPREIRFRARLAWLYQPVSEGDSLHRRFSHGMQRVEVVAVAAMRISDTFSRTGAANR
ncbi:peptide-methionine (R)-S-oxide reductase [Salmonella enterica subsp. enterica]|nr:peptide-methionine (R)-S-oxide reductase [Salmonella enterica subsp. enterica]